MQIGQVLKLIGGLLQVIVSLLKEIRSHGKERNKMMYPDLVQKKYAELWHNLHVKYYLSALK